MTRMELSFKFFANFREAVGQKTITREFPDGTTAGEVLAELAAEFEELDLLEDGDLRPQINVLRNGRGVVHMDGVDTVLEDEDTLSIFPPVAGGSEEAVDAGDTTVTESFRGISQRLAVKYLGNLGGDHVAGDADGEGEDRVAGDDWAATVTSETVTIGTSSLQLTEVTIRFEGAAATLRELVEEFSQKAMRAGG
jgi:MoaD family protein